MKKCVSVLAVVSLCLLVTSSLLAQRNQPQEIYKILGISVDGNTLADPAAVIANSGLKVGDEVTVPGDQVSQAIRKLWSLKIFEDIQIGVDRKVGQGADRKSTRLNSSH
jgi:outer membrane protein insertion porin family